MKRRPIRHAVACHEAGHCVVAVVLGATVSHVQCVPAWSSLGHAIIDDTGLTSNQRDMINLAGDTAVLLYAPLAYPMLEAYSRTRQALRQVEAKREEINRLMSDYDLPEITEQDVRETKHDLHKLAPEVSLYDRIELAHIATHRAADILEANHRAFVIIVDELMRLGELTGARVTEIVKGVRTRLPIQSRLTRRSVA